PRPICARSSRACSRSICWSPIERWRRASSPTAAPSARWRGCSPERRNRFLLNSKRDVSASEPADLREMMALLKGLWKLRPPGDPEPPGARLIRRWREKRLLARLERGWPGGFTLHRTGDLVYVPHPLDARGRHALLHPPHA